MIMGVLLLGWVIFCAIQWIRHGKDLIFKGDFTGQIKCVKCGHTYTAGPAEFARSSMVRSRSISKTEVRNGMFIQRPKYSYYARKFQCPFCRKRVYGQVLNINEISDRMMAPAIKSGMRWLIYMCIGGFAIMMVMDVCIHFADQANKRRVDELRQEYYEDLKEQYDPGLI